MVTDFPIQRVLFSIAHHVERLEWSRVLFVTNWFILGVKKLQVGHRAIGRCCKLGFSFFFPINPSGIALSWFVIHVYLFYTSIGVECDTMYLLLSENCVARKKFGRFFPNKTLWEDLLQDSYFIIRIYINGIFVPSLCLTIFYEFDIRFHAEVVFGIAIHKAILSLYSLYRSQFCPCLISK